MNLERLKEIPNGEKVVPTFSITEMESRLTALRKQMADDGLDAVVFTSYHNINYYSDFLYTAFGRPYALVVTQDSSTTVSANIDAGMPWRRTLRRQRRLHRLAPRQLRLRRPAGAGQTRGSPRAASASRTTTSAPTCWPGSPAALPGMQPVDVAAATMRLRMIKSAEEIALIKHGARIGDLGGEAIRDAITEGVPEYEVAIAGSNAMIREIARTFPHAELRDTWVWFQSGINTDGAHNWATSRRVQRGDILSLNCFPMIAGYYTALERTLFYGQPSAEHLRLWEINVKVHRRGLELIQPGAVCKDICAELNEIYEAEGLLPSRTFGYGHSFGVLSHYYGREAGLELREDIDTVLEPGMVVSMEPMIMIPEGQPGAGGYREHDILVVGENSAENITKFPFGPEHNILGA